MSFPESPHATVCLCSKLYFRRTCSRASSFPAFLETISRNLSIQKHQTDQKKAHWRTPPFPNTTGDDIDLNIGCIHVFLNALHGTVQRCLLDAASHFVLVLLVYWPVERNHSPFVNGRGVASHLKCIFSDPTESSACCVAFCTVFSCHPSSSCSTQSGSSGHSPSRCE